MAKYAATIDGDARQRSQVLPIRVHFANYLRQAITICRGALIVRTCYTIQLPVLVHGTVVSENGKDYEKKEDIPYLIKDEQCQGGSSTKPA